MLHLDGERLLGRIDALATVSSAGLGVTRLAYSHEDAVARDLVGGWMREAGLSVSCDAIGNLVGLSFGNTDGGLLGLGSHLDSVIQAGPLDGAYGVIAAIEVAAALEEAISRSDKGVAVVAFSNEEGARGSVPMIGSLGFVGGLDEAILAATDDEGVSIADRIRSLGGHPEVVGLGMGTCPAGLEAFLELHIEQGPFLEAAGVDIGVVEVITGRRSLEVVLKGRSSHAGTTPMNQRSDALVAAAHLIVALEGLARGGEVRVATVGYINAYPNMRNVIPGHVAMAVDLRDVQSRRLEQAVKTFEAIAKEISATTDVTIDVHTSSAVEPVQTDLKLCDAIDRAAIARGASVVRMASGAGHDSQIVAAALPTGLLFVPSESGISHSPFERTRGEDLMRGAEVLLQACADYLELDGE